MGATGAFTITIDGKDLPADVSPLLTSAWVDTSVRLPDMFTLRFRDGDRIVVTKTGVKIGAKVTITITTDDTASPTKLLVGEVTALEAEHDSLGTFTSIRGYDPAHRLFRARHTESYVQMTASDVATKIAQRAQIETGNITATTTVYDQLSQCGQTDWEFLDALARQIGYEVQVRDGKFSFGPRPEASAAKPSSGNEDRNPLVLKLGTDLLRFRSVVTSADQVSKVEVRGWDIAQKTAIVAHADAGTKALELPTVTPADMAKPFGNPEYVATDTAFRTQAEADAAAKALAEFIGSSFAELEAVARGNPALRANVPISIENIGEPFEGKYTITSARHRYDPTGGGYTTLIAVTGRQERSLLGLTGGASSSTTGAGVVIGVVSDVHDPMEQGRVKLTFPWLSAEFVSDWSRTVQPGAGKDRGTLVLPEVGDEVLVAFEQNDAMRPYVIGGLYNGVDKPAKHKVPVIDSGSGAVNRRSFVSRKGHRLDFLDDEGRTEGISIETTDGKQSIVLDSVGTQITVHADGTIKIESTKGIVIDAGSASIEMKAKDISLTATAGVKIAGGTGKVGIDTNGPVEVSGTAVKVAGKASAELSASGTTVISGSLVKIN